MMKKIILPALVFSLIISFAFKVFDDRDDFELIKNLEIYHNVLKQLHYNYVDEIDSRALITSSIDKMLEQLDPYTVYYPESQIETIRIISKAQYTGIGITVDTFENEIFVVEIEKGSESDKAGLRIGDIVVEINGFSVIDKSLDEFHNLASGQLGTKIKLKIRRFNKELEYNISRQVVNMKAVSASTKVDDYGYIKLENFSDKSYFEFQSAYFELKKQNIEGLIIDLRDNPGGLLDQAVKIVNLFIPKNKVVVTSKGKSDNSNMTFMTKQKSDDLKIPIVVLVNGNSASASEIVAGTLQDYDRAVIIGENTFGKGLVQRIFDLGYNSKMKITVSKYFIPSGRCIQAIDYSHEKNYDVNKNQKFYTSKGRIVYEGNGIKPDILILNDTLNETIKTFVNKFVIFRFINEYWANSDTNNWGKPQDVKFDDIALFLKFVEENNYLNYIKQFEKIKSLESNTDNNGIIFKQLQILKKMYVDDIKEIIIDNKDVLNRIISRGIVERKFYRKGIIVFDLKYDTEIQKGKQILSSNIIYKDILGY